MRFHYTLCDSESESESAMIVVPRLPEIVEKVRHVGGRDSGPRIDHLNDDALTIRHRFERDFPIGRCEFECVFEQVDEDALDLGGVDLDERRLGRQPADDPVALRTEAVQRAGDEIGRASCRERVSIDV